MFGPGVDLPSLLRKKDHLGALRYIRAHELREPALVVEEGQKLLGGPTLSTKLVQQDPSATVAALEQICIAALDLHNHELAEQCLAQIKDHDVSKDSVRYRRLLGRCLEAAEDYEGALLVYEDLLKDNPCNLVALQRKYCVLRVQQKEPPQVVLAALNEYIGQQMADVTGWYEMSKLRMSLADYKGAAYALEQVILGSPLDGNIHCELAEVYATMGGIENTSLARKHMAQALELDPTNIRAQFGLVSIANQYLDECKEGSKKAIDEHELLVAQELVRYGAAEVIKSYKSGSKTMAAAVKRVMDDFTENLDIEN